jgi:hypothetical protein
MHIIRRHFTHISIQHFAVSRASHETDRPPWLSTGTARCGVSRQVAKLETVGLASRRANTVDRRVREVVVTPMGLAMTRGRSGARETDGGHHLDMERRRNS